MKKFLFTALVLSSALSFAGEDYPVYGGILNFKGVENHVYEEFQGKTVWATCMDERKVCEEFAIVVKNVHGEVSVGRTLNKVELPQRLENILETMYYTYGSKILNLTGKGLYAKIPTIIYYPTLVAALAADIIISPVTYPIGKIQDNKLGKQIGKVFNSLFDKNLAGKSIIIVTNDDKGHLNHENHELSKRLPYELQN